MASVVMVPFHGDGAGVAELTWGQREIWAAMRTQRSRLPIGGVVPLPAGRDVDAVAAALRFTMSRHQSLRTRLRFEPDGSVRQVLSDHGEVPLHVVDVPDDSDPAAVAAELEARIRSEPFDYEHDWPVQMTVIRHRGVATHLLGLFCHLSVDGGGMVALFGDGLGGLFTEGDASGPTAAGLTPFAQVAWQQGPSGRRLNQAAQRRWKRQLANVPASRFADTDDERRPRHWEVLFHSPAAHLAVRAITARTGTESSAVVLAAVAVALARVTDRHPTVLQVVVSNRFRPGLADTVSPIAQTGLCVIDVADATFDDAIERARQSAMSAYLHAYYNPDEMTEQIAELGRERGEDIDLACFFNDRRGPDSPEPAGPPTRQDIADALVMTTERWGPYSDTPFERFFVHLDSAPDTLNVLLQADTRYVPPDDMRTFLHEFESVLVAAAFDPATTTRRSAAPLR